MELVRPCGTIVLKATQFNKPPEFDMNRLVIDEIKLIGSRCGPFDMALSALEKKLVDVEPLISAVIDFDEGIKAIRMASNREMIKVLLRM